MSMNTAIRAGALGLSMAGLSTGAFAADWIEKVEVKRDGIDVVPIEVSANANGYTGIKAGQHRFLLQLYARATNGERIVAMKLGSFNPVRYFESDGDLWSKSYAHRDVGAGSKRTVTIHDEPVIALSKVYWAGHSPRARCEAALANEMKKGQSKAKVLSKTLTAKAWAYFELDAVAAHKNKAVKNKWSIKNTTDQRGTYIYELSVKCLPGVKPPRASTSGGATLTIKN